MNPLLLPLSAGFRLGVAIRHRAYRHGWLRTHRLARPVISVGNLTTGGTGKTPLVVEIARMLLGRGMKPSILTRGYGRRGQAGMIVLAPGASRRPDPGEVGDEPALLARALPEVPIVVAAERYRAGQTAEAEFAVDVHILDDGFQHLALARSLDILTIDSTRPLSNWRLLPAGRQREPHSALQRAQVVVLTRTDSANPQPLEELISMIHPAARIFRSRTEMIRWTEASTGEAASVAAIQAKKVAAFCGIGNPQAFFGDLRRWGFSLAAEDAFPDHHVYTSTDIQRLVVGAQRHGAVALLTTQKDAVKLREDGKLPLPILAGEIAARIADAAEFEATLFSHLEEAH